MLAAVQVERLLRRLGGRLGPAFGNVTRDALACAYGPQASRNRACNSAWCWLAVSDRLVGKLVLAVLTATAGLAGCGSSSSPSSEARRLPAKPSCASTGFRYVGTTDQDTTVCFTLTVDGNFLVEIGFEFPLGCSLSGSLQSEVAPAKLGPHRRIRQEVSVPVREDVAPSFLFRGSIRGAAASGALSSFGPYCKSDTVAWTASRVP
jgi:hypothetical protein